MANYNYTEWVERLTDKMWDTLNTQLIGACQCVRTEDSGWFRFRDRVMGEFTDKYKIIEITVNGDLSDRELTTLLTFERPLDRAYQAWVRAVDADKDGHSKFDLLDEAIDNLAESRLNYIIKNYATMDKGNRAEYFDRVMMCTGQTEYDPTGDVFEEDEEDLEQ